MFMQKRAPSQILDDSERSFGGHRIKKKSDRGLPGKGRNAIKGPICQNVNKYRQKIKERLQLDKLNFLLILSV